MINPKKLIEMARKWRKVAPSKRNISFSRLNGTGDETVEQGRNSVAHKGHFVVYTLDSRRFVVPLEWLSSNIFRDLFRMSEEEFGLPTDGPIMLPCDSVFLEYVVLLF
ncbi:hypothetical protein NE237_017458 [Protea cynaroides]|uniref:Small auxin up regulated protein n=1 Tax=Protea cynaroides TaxID=273540 RepID=A0A9Q0QN79_9MAGN|nr:hypothetical protein NE237_017458 [Protea cynaroides]